MTSSTRTIQYPSFSLDLPDDLETEENEEGTTLALFAGTYMPSLRISSLTIMGENARPGEGVRQIEELAPDRNLRLYTVDDKTVMVDEMMLDDDEPHLFMKVWYVGFHQTIIIISLTMDCNELEGSLTMRMLGYMPDIIESIR